MYTMIDYVKWRGDLPFSKSELNPVDILVLCQISYIHFEGIIPNKIGVKHGISLQDAKNAYFSKKRNEKYLGFLSEQTYDIFKEAADSERFRQFTVSGYVSTLEEKKEMQFSTARIMTYYSFTLLQIPSCSSGVLCRTTRISVSDKPGSIIL